MSNCLLSPLCRQHAGLLPQLPVTYGSSDMLDAPAQLPWMPTEKKCAAACA